MPSLPMIFILPENFNVSKNVQTEIPNKNLHLDDPLDEITEYEKELFSPDHGLHSASSHDAFVVTLETAAILLIIFCLAFYFMKSRCALFMRPSATEEKQIVDYKPSDYDHQELIEDGAEPQPESQPICDGTSYDSTLSANSSNVENRSPLVDTRNDEQSSSEQSKQN